jgi:hypothetical protein
MDAMDPTHWWDSRWNARVEKLIRRTTSCEKRGAEGHRWVLRELATLNEQLSRDEMTDLGGEG